MEGPKVKELSPPSASDDPVVTTGGLHSADEGTTNEIHLALSPCKTQDTNQMSSEIDGIGSNRPFPAVQHIQHQSLSVSGTLHQPTVMDGSIESRMIIKKKGRFTVTPDAIPTTPKVLERSVPLNQSQTTPTTIQKGRFTVTPDTEAGQVNFAPENTAVAAPIFVTTVAGGPKVEKKGRFVVSSAIASGVYVDSEILLPQTFDRPLTIPIQAAPAAQPPTEALNQHPPSIPVKGKVGHVDPAIASLNVSEETSGNIFRNVAARDKSPASFHTNDIASDVGLGRVLTFLEQIKADVLDADRNAKLLQREIKFLKEKNRELELRNEEIEKRWKDQKAYREAAEFQVRVLKAKLKDVENGVKDCNLTEIGKSSRSNSIGNVETVFKPKAHSDLGSDVIEKLNGLDLSSLGNQLMAQSIRRPSDDSTSWQIASTAGQTFKTEIDLTNSASGQGSAQPGSQQTAVIASVRPQMTEVRHARNRSDEGSQHFVNSSHRRASSSSGTSVSGANLNASIPSTDSAIGIIGNTKQHQQPAAVVQQQTQQTRNQGHYSITKQQQSLQKKPPLKPIQSTGINHQGVQQQPQNGMQGMSSQKAHQKIPQQQPHGVRAVLQQQLVIPSMAHQQSVLAMQHPLPHSQQLSVIAPPQGLQQMSCPPQQVVSSQQQSIQKQSHTPQKLNAQTVGQNPQSLQINLQQPPSLPSSPHLQQAMLQHQHSQAQQLQYQQPQSALSNENTSGSTAGNAVVSQQQPAFGTSLKPPQPHQSLQQPALNGSQWS